MIHRPMIFLLFAVVVVVVFPFPWNIVVGVALATCAIAEGMFWFGRLRGMQRRLALEAENRDDGAPGAGGSPPA
jgi:hypothetical protein